MNDGAGSASGIEWRIGATANFSEEEWMKLPEIARVTGESARARLGGEEFYWQ